MSDDATVVLTDIKSALASAEKEAEQKPAALLVVGGELNGTIFDLKEDITICGRSPDSQITLDFNGISRQHFKLTTTAEGFALEDAGSKNGTFLNNKKIEGATIIKKGDIIKLGSIALKYLPKGDPERLTYDKLNLEANTDKHTGCYNKTYFNDKIELEVKKCMVTGNPLSLIIFDLDHFKKLNDNYGHDAGDFVLKDAAALIRKTGVRENDIFARYGGEEFVILLPKTNLKQSFEIAERLRKLLETHKFIYENQILPVTASIGVADYRQGVKTGTDLFKRADEAVYKAKQGGRNQVQFYRA
ncbi:diguanylate cyclase (GGDEF) domain protein [Bacteriovorax sp. BSW11_IV]|uniref:GGDEF domain-containing protein n=1 Tax=Bacteriovorax sp. BSW11_IV TaxID=1353529 RepID=UPI00038A1AE1|nr:GGDEF domain-containing protein [Bacteriovorax sp. BSW11_IV]EQC48212.1 diguanylate cyclase (GGDEF) domain protein [Bacteriovorax sp. BSW11_IV]